MILVRGLIPVFISLVGLFACQWKPGYDMHETMLDDRHYLANRIYLETESDLNQKQLTQQFPAAKNFFVGLDSINRNRITAATRGGNSDNSNSSADLLSQAYALLLQDQLQAARDILQQLLSFNPEHDLAMKMLLSLSVDRKQSTAVWGEREKTTVKVGDSWQTLSQQIYGSPLQFYALVLLNNSKAQNTLHPGQVIRIPVNHQVEQGGLSLQDLPEFPEQQLIDLVVQASAELKSRGVLSEQEWQASVEPLILRQRGLR